MLANLQFFVLFYQSLKNNKYNCQIKKIEQLAELLKHLQGIKKKTLISCHKTQWQLIVYSHKKKQHQQQTHLLYMMITIKLFKLKMSRVIVHNLN